MIIKSSNYFETKKAGRDLAEKILKKRKTKKAEVLALEGDLGGGKTTFLQGFAKGLGIKEKILSPTFVLMKKFKIPKGKNFKNFYHFDFYRIKNTEEISTLGFKDIASDPQNILAIEWSEKIKKILPKQRISLKFYFINEKNRKICIKKFY